MNGILDSVRWPCTLTAPGAKSVHCRSLQTSTIVPFIAEKENLHWSHRGALLSVFSRSRMAILRKFPFDFVFKHLKGGRRPPPLQAKGRNHSVFNLIRVLLISSWQSSRVKVAWKFAISEQKASSKKNKNEISTQPHVNGKFVIKSCCVQWL